MGALVPIPRVRHNLARQARTIRRWQYVANEYRALYTRLLATLYQAGKLRSFGRAWYNAYQRRKAAEIKDKGRLAERARIVAALRKMMGELSGNVASGDARVWAALGEYDSAVRG